MVVDPRASAFGAREISQTNCSLHVRGPAGPRGGFAKRIVLYLFEDLRDPADDSPNGLFLNCSRTCGTTCKQMVCRDDMSERRVGKLSAEMTCRCAQNAEFFNVFDLQIVLDTNRPGRPFRYFAPGWISATHAGRRRSRPGQKQIVWQTARGHQPGRAAG